MTAAERDRLLPVLQSLTDETLKLLGLPKHAWGDLTIRLENGRVVLPVETRFTWK
jgi:hypothetical protein